MIRRKPALYLAVTADVYELPLFVAESADELAKWTGAKVKSVHEQICKWKNRPPKNSPRNYCGYRYRRVDIEEDAE